MFITQLEIARVCHEANRAFCLALGDDSQVEWNSAPEWHRESAIKGVLLHLNSDADAAASHDSWMRQKVEDGWVYGPVKDAEAKTHPCIVPFDELPREQQCKDYLFRAIVHALRPIAEIPMKMDEPPVQPKNTFA